MKNKIKILFSASFVIFGLLIFAACSSVENPYEINDKEGYNVSIKYDANGGTFTTNTSVIVDSYNLSEIKKDSEGMCNISLLPPNSELRGTDAFEVSKNGHFLAGWYRNRYETKDAEGNVTYSYSDKWEFEEDSLKLDSSKTYSSSEPVITLYAAWIPMFEFNFIDIYTNESIGNYVYNPLEENEFLIPTINTETGRVDMYKFPEKKGYTFVAAYKDENGMDQISTESLTHTAQIDFETGTCSNTVMGIFVEYVEGDWYHIYNADQFIENASVNGNYIINNDLDFSGKIWPTTLINGNFNGVIQGNSHTISGITAEQTNNSKTYSGLFGNITDNAKIDNITFEDVKFTIKAGSRVNGSYYGLFAGSLSSNASLTNVNLNNSVLEISSEAYFSTTDYRIGLICGIGNEELIKYSNVTISKIGEETDKFDLQISNDNEVLIIYE